MERVQVAGDRVALWMRRHRSLQLPPKRERAHALDQPLAELEQEGEARLHGGEQLAVGKDQRGVAERAAVLCGFVGLARVHDPAEEVLPEHHEEADHAANVTELHAREGVGRCEAVRGGWRCDWWSKVCCTFTSKQARKGDVLRQTLYWVCGNCRKALEWRAKRAHDIRGGCAAARAAHGCEGQRPHLAVQWRAKRALPEEPGRAQPVVLVAARLATGEIHGVHHRITIKPAAQEQQVTARAQLRLAVVLSRARDDGRGSMIRGGRTNGSRQQGGAECWAPCG